MDLATARGTYPNPAAPAWGTTAVTCTNPVVPVLPHGEPEPRRAIDEPTCGAIPGIGLSKVHIQLDFSSWILLDVDLIGSWTSICF
jgi:hypothetical protein